jgi:hypothetical protein
MMSQSSKKSALEIIAQSSSDSKEINMPDIAALRQMHHDQAPVVTGIQGIHIVII